jgi:hypothetical protein
MLTAEIVQKKEELDDKPRALLPPWSDDATGSQKPERYFQASMIDHVLPRSLNSK